MKHVLFLILQRPDVQWLLLALRNGSAVVQKKPHFSEVKYRNREGKLFLK